MEADGMVGLEAFVNAVNVHSTAPR